LLLDEAMSVMDAKSECVLQEVLEWSMKGRRGGGQHEEATTAMSRRRRAGKKSAGRN
jgi:ABC-type multidrug transport system fused ATPase/permease subunit